MDPVLHQNEKHQEEKMGGNITAGPEVAHSGAMTSVVDPVRS
jgi:hypothetical protein